jgi:hypothetical protein
MAPNTSLPITTPLALLLLDSPLPYSLFSFSPLTALSPVRIARDSSQECFFFFFKVFCFFLIRKHRTKHQSLLQMVLYMFR